MLVCTLPFAHRAVHHSKSNRFVQSGREGWFSQSQDLMPLLDAAPSLVLVVNFLAFLHTLPVKVTSPEVFTASSWLVNRMA